jgi:hypothetical protein
VSTTEVVIAARDDVREHDVALCAHTRHPLNDTGGVTARLGVRHAILCWLSVSLISAPFQCDRYCHRSCAKNFTPYWSPRIQLVSPQVDISSSCDGSFTSMQFPVDPDMASMENARR